MVAAQTSYCLADVAAAHCWTGTAFVPIEFYFEYREDVLHFTTQEEAEAVVRWQRQEHDGYLRVMRVGPTGLVRLQRSEQEPEPLAVGKEAGVLDCDQMAETILGILQSMRRHPKRFARMAGRRNISVDQLTAAAIAEAIREQLERAPLGWRRLTSPED